MVNVLDMDEYQVLIIGVVYNEKGEFLVASRSPEEKILPGLYSYQVGGMRFNKEEKLNALEKALHREVEDETGVKVEEPIYLSSQQYLLENNKTLAVAFLSKYKEGEVSSVTDETEKVEWMSIENIRELQTSPLVLDVYESAWRKLNERNKLHHLSVAGIILNQNDEYLLVKDKNSDEELFTFPIFDVEKDENTSWETVAKSLASQMKSEFDLELMDGAIPFTDQSFNSVDDLGGVVEFYIGKVNQNEAKDGIVWKNFSELDQVKMLPSIYNIYSLASKFISDLAVRPT